MALNPIALIVFICAIMIAVIAVYAWRQGKIEMAKVFTLFMVAMDIYIFGYSFELASLKISLMLFWNKVQYIGILSFPALYLIFASHFSGSNNWVTKKNAPLLFIIPFVCLVIKFFDDSLQLIYSSSTIDYSGTIPLLSFEKGPIYYITVAYNLVMVTIGTFLLVYKRRHASSLYLRQTNIILGVSIVLYASYLLYLSGIEIIPNFKNIDLNPFVYTLWGFAISYAILKYKLFDLVPIARDALIEILGDAVLVLDDQFRLVDSNPKAQAIFGWNKTPLGLKIEESELPLVDTKLFQSLTGDYCFEKQIIRENQKTVYEITVSLLRNKQQFVVGYLLVMHDISNRKKIEEELHELSLVDDLTKLINRRGFFVLSDQLCTFCLRMEMNAILFFFDMDNLKQINDQFGHAAGDQAIIDMAFILKKSFRSSDIVARFGGDEFVVLAIETTENSKKSMFARLEEQLKNMISDKTNNFNLSFSTGSAIYEWKNPVSLERLVNDADQAMYIEKQSKKRS
ncbi:MAG: hypothetical protein CVU42_09215 [Chloroflexi bacterium HGW-Chloroflexi-4]|jgi:diguanylate cyclase (GGDEF)-like protein/PAS domain S-box-containing protein|nr:MAG: hypothetical protein CVU42_09215 [Chloroflexi bacterium HGW-Chloroflexi-4]